MAEEVRVRLNGRNFSWKRWLGGHWRLVAGQGRRYRVTEKQEKNWGDVESLSPRKFVMAEVVRSNPRSVVVRLPDGSIVRRKRQRDLTGGDAVMRRGRMARWLTQKPAEHLGA